MIRILLNTAAPGYKPFQAAILKELKRQRARIVSDTIDEYDWRIITAEAA